MHGIYSIVRTSNGDRYVGSSSSIHKRLAQHYSALRNGRHKNIHLQRAWLLYGEEAFDFEVLEETGLSDLIEREQFYISQPQSVYNMAPIAGRPPTSKPCPDGCTCKLHDGNSGTICPVGCKCARHSKSGNRTPRLEEKCPPGCTCKRHTPNRVYGPCPPDCKCERHLLSGRRQKCLPGCRCIRHVQTSVKCQPGCTCGRHEQHWKKRVNVPLGAA